MFQFGDQTYSETDDYIEAINLHRVKNLQDGDIFELGGLSIQTYNVPGHTKGCMVMLIRERGILLLGDACNYLTLVFGTNAASVTEYEAALKDLLKKVDCRYDTVLLSHSPGMGYCGIIEDMIGVCDDVRSGNTEDIPFELAGQTGLIAKQYKECQKANLVYVKENI